MTDTLTASPPRSGRVNDEPIARAWAAAYDAAPEACRWEPAHVDERLTEAMRICAQAAGPVGPRILGRAWPAIARIYERLNEFDTTPLDSLPKDPDDDRRPIPRLTARQISDMEEAIEWPGRYIVGHFPQRQVLALWMRCKANRKSFRKALKQGGYVEGTAKRRRWQASLLIATGLIRDRIPAPPPTVIHPFESVVEPVQDCAPVQNDVCISMDPFWAEIELMVALTEPDQLPVALDIQIGLQVQHEFRGQTRSPKTFMAMQNRLDSLRSETIERYALPANLWQRGKK